MAPTGTFRQKRLLPLPLFMLRVGAPNMNHALPANHLALVTHFLD
jgi:hypothetical protein